MDRSYLADMERGKRNPSLVNIELIARGFGLTVSQLVSRL
ncbi:MAG TPA: helix-turn-helix transcriptional regulator [Terriglobia bacterium]|nr:helix-turn-helix transcriptional regulator [Terriglobia bacterium]